MATRRSNGVVSSFARRFPVLAATNNARKFGYGGDTDLDFAENHTGSFGSQLRERHSDLYNNSPTGLTPAAPAMTRVGGPKVNPALESTVAPVASHNIAPIVTPPTALGPDYAPLTRNAKPTAGQEARILGMPRKAVQPVVQPVTTTDTTSHVNAPTPIGSGEAILGNTPLQPRVTPQLQSAIPSDPFGGLDLNSRVGPAPFSLDKYQRTPSTAESAGATVKGVVQSIPKDTIFGSTATGELPPVAPADRIVDIPKVVGDFTRGLFGATPNTSTGVSNKSAAQFQTPTKENPVPKTDTTPTANIDKADSSIASFGLSEDEMARKKRLMTSLADL